MRGIAGEVAQLVRVGGEIEELRPIHERVADQFPAVVAHRALAVAIGGVERVADFGFPALENRGDVPAFDAYGKLRAAAPSSARPRSAGSAPPGKSGVGGKTESWIESSNTGWKGFPAPNHSTVC